MAAVTLSIVVPVYNSAACLPALAERVRRDVVPHFTGIELILVNDDSPDDSWVVIEALARRYEFVRGLQLRKNVGQDNAIMAGLHHARGDAVVIMDDDLQHDPADIPKLCAGLGPNADVVFANFRSRHHAGWKNAGSWLADWAARLVLQKPAHIYMSPFKVIARDVVDEIIRYRGPFSYIDGLIFTITRRVAQVDVEHHDRLAGVSNYTLLRSVSVWLKLVTGFSVVPLRLAMFMGGAMAFIAFLMAIFFVIQTLLMGSQSPPGWPSLIVAVFFLGGIQLMGIGMAGEYIGRIFVTQNQAPQFSIRASTDARADASGPASVGAAERAPGT